jgi:predicted phage-related endonuclease
VTAPEWTRAQWLRAKREPIVTLGSSSAAAACGLGKRESALHLHLVMRGEIPPDSLDEHADYIEAGNFFEPCILRWYAHRCRRRLLDPLTERDRIEHELTKGGGCEVVAWVRDELYGRFQPFIRSTARPWQVATLDGCALVPETDELELPEVKNQDEWRSSDWADGTAPRDYLIQALHQLAVVTSATRAMLFGVVGGNDPRAVPIPRVAADVENLNTCESAFMANLAAGIEPDADASDSSTRALRHRYPGDNGRTRILPAKSVELHRELVEIEAQLEPYEELVDRKEALRARLRQLLGDFEYGELPDGTAAYSLKTDARGTRVLRSVSINRRKRA